MLQVDVATPAGVRPLRFPIRARGLMPRLTATPRLLHFGGVACGEWADQQVEVANGCGELPLHVAIDRGGPYFHADPAAFTLPPSGRTAVLLRYQPKALGNHTAAVALKAVVQASSSSGGGGGGGGALELAAVVVEAHGSCLQVADKVPLVGGPEAIPEDFAKET